MTDIPKFVQRFGESLFTAPQIYQAAVDAGYNEYEATVLLNRLQYNRALAEGELMTVGELMRNYRIVDRTVSFGNERGIVTDYARVDEDWLLVINGQIYRKDPNSEIRMYPVGDGTNEVVAAGRPIKITKDE